MRGGSFAVLSKSPVFEGRSFCALSGVTLLTGFFAGRGRSYEYANADNTEKRKEEDFAALLRGRLVKGRRFGRPF